MHADTATRQHWMSVLAHSQPAELAARLKALNICNQVNHLIPTRVLVKGGEITCKILK
ncbi:hypothetical protein H2M99_002170 [Escherichia coli]|nr:hypothetical protein [Escherichia coli]